jgi:hypothetical protein
MSGALAPEGEQGYTVAGNAAMKQMKSSRYYPSGVRHRDGHLTNLKGTGFSPYVKTVKSTGL